MALNYIITCFANQIRIPYPTHTRCNILSPRHLCSSGSIESSKSWVIVSKNFFPRPMRNPTVMDNSSIKLFNCSNSIMDDFKRGCLNSIRRHLDMYLRWDNVIIYVHSYRYSYNMYILDLHCLCVYWLFVFINSEVGCHNCHTGWLWWPPRNCTFKGPII